MEKTPQPSQPHPQQIQIQVDASEAKDFYANLVLIAHSPSEFILDFARMLPGTPKAKLCARIIMTPQNAQVLMKGLEARVKAYETQYGKIPGQIEPPSHRDIGFKTEGH